MTKPQWPINDQCPMTKGQGKREGRRQPRRRTLHTFVASCATQQSFLRLLSNATIAKAYGVAPLSNRDVLKFLDGFMSSSAVGYVDEPAGAFDRWKALADLPTPSPKRWMDAYLAAFALEGALPFVTGDTDFNAFAGLNPTILITPAKPSTGGTSVT